MATAYKYFAFISYNSHDQEWGWRIQRKLENYSMPSTLCSEHGWMRKPMRPIFFAPTDIQPNGLSEELQERLRASKNLIVVCSPNSARSEWVGREIAFFHQLGRTKNIHFFIVDGTPHSGDPATECFNPVVKELGMQEILGVNIHEQVYRRPWLNRERAYVQLITKMLGVEFDSIWQRHKRRKIQQIVLVGFAVLAVACALLGVWWANKPVDVRMQAVESSFPNKHLPPTKEAVITLELDNETKTDTVTALLQEALFANVPRRFIGREVRVQVNCRDFLSVDTLLMLHENVTLNMYRDVAKYGKVCFKVYDFAAGKVIPNLALKVGGQKVVSDAEGYVRLNIPLEGQRTLYEVVADEPQIQDTIFMPCGEDDHLIINEQ